MEFETIMKKAVPILSAFVVGWAMVLAVYCLVIIAELTKW